MNDVTLDIGLDNNEVKIYSLENRRHQLEDFMQTLDSVVQPWLRGLLC